MSGVCARIVGVTSSLCGSLRRPRRTSLRRRGCDQWSDAEIDVEFAVTLIDGDVPAIGWRKSAEAFLERFER